MKTKKIEFDNRTLLIAETIKGLTSEGRKVYSKVLNFEPDVVALPLDREGIRAIIQWINKKKKEKVLLSNYEVLYAKHLSRFGKVEVPAPSFVESIKAAQEIHKSLFALDMDAGQHAQVYVENVTSFQLFLHSLRFKLFSLKKFKAKTAREFAIEYDAAINTIKGLRKVEQAREKYMAHQLYRLCKSFPKVLAVLEVERAEGVSTVFRNLIQQDCEVIPVKNELIVP
ncbi:MAG: hypothetical protein QW728_03805 [Thermoplasmata archaeon]